MPNGRKSSRRSTLPTHVNSPSTVFSLDASLSSPAASATTTALPIPDRSKPSKSTSIQPQRTSKTSHKLVVLPSAPQTKVVPAEVEEDLAHEYETDAGVTMREYKSAAERMSKEERKMAGFKRITAYCVAETFKMKLLASFLKREHNVLPRVFDEALYVVYHLPLLPGYGPNANIRSSVSAVPANGAKSFLSRLAEAEENGYQGSYFMSGPMLSPPPNREDSFDVASPPDTQTPRDILPDTPWSDTGEGRAEREDSPSRPAPVEEIAEVVLFAYGVAVFFGLDEGQEKNILEDIEKAGVLNRKIDEDDWEVEEFHFMQDPQIAYPRVYNDFFTLKSHSHLLKLSIAHALAQSTLLAHYEANATRVLSAPLTLSIPTQLAQSGVLKLKRREALKLTGRLFKLRRDINLVSNVLDIPELFWSEASLKMLYDAVREYMEIRGRVQALNEKLGMAGDFLDAIHDHLNNDAMHRITWVIIWLIVVAVLVELGEIIARLAVHGTIGRATKPKG